MKIETSDLLAIKQHLGEAVTRIDSLLASNPETDLAENDRVKSKVPRWFEHPEQKTCKF
jgi:hypothetical protein